jgi:hypothetical protein
MYMGCAGKTTCFILPTTHPLLQFVSTGSGQVLLNQPTVAFPDTVQGPAVPPSWSSTFTSTAKGDLLVKASFSAYTNEPKVKATFEILLDTMVMASQTFHFNFNGQHLSIPAFLVLLPNVSKGTHTLKIRIPQDTQVNDKDHASMVVSWC